MRQRIRFHPRVNDLRIGWGECDADASLHRLGKAAATHFAPGCAGIRCLPKSAPGTTALQEVGTAHPLPARSIESVVILCVHRQIHESGLVADKLDQLPRRSAVGGFVHAALRIRVPGVAQCRDVDNVRVGGIDDDATDLLRPLEPPQLPRAPGIGRFINAGARRDGVARIFFSRAGVDDIGVGSSNRDVAHRDHAFLVEHGEEHRSGIDGFPDSSSRRGDVEDFGISRDRLDVGYPSRHIRRTDRSPAKAGKRSGIEWSCELGRAWAGAEQCAGESGENRIGSHWIGPRLNNRSGEDRETLAQLS